MMNAKIEAGCMAIIIKGNNSGKIVGVIQYLRPHHKCYYNNKEWRNPMDRGEWLIEGVGLDTKEGQRNIALAPTTWLMRIDGSWPETDADICDNLDQYFDLRKLRE